MTERTDVQMSFSHGQTDPEFEGNRSRDTFRKTVKKSINMDILETGALRKRKGLSQRGTFIRADAQITENDFRQGQLRIQSNIEESYLLEDRGGQGLFLFILRREYQRLNADTGDWDNIENEYILTEQIIPLGGAQTEINAIVYEPSLPFNANSDLVKTGFVATNSFADGPRTYNVFRWVGQTDDLGTGKNYILATPREITFRNLETLKIGDESFVLYLKFLEEGRLRGFWPLFLDTGDRGFYGIAGIRKGNNYLRVPTAQRSLLSGLLDFKIGPAEWPFTSEVYQDTAIDFNPRSSAGDSGLFFETGIYSTSSLNLGLRDTDNSELAITFNKVVVGNDEALTFEEKVFTRSVPSDETLGEVSTLGLLEDFIPELCLPRYSCDRIYQSASPSAHLFCRYFA